MLTNWLTLTILYLKGNKIYEKLSYFETDPLMKKNIVTTCSPFAKNAHQANNNIELQIISATTGNSPIFVHY